jgi:hypothetical protein
VTTGPFPLAAAACSCALATGCGAAPLLHGVRPVALPGVPAMIAEKAIDADPPADSLSIHCRFQGVSLGLTDVYLCAGEYEGSRVKLRLEHYRAGPQYRYRVLEPSSRWGRGSGVCTAQSQGC